MLTRNREFTEILDDYLERVSKVEDKVTELDKDLQAMNSSLSQIKTTLNRCLYVFIALLSTNNPISAEILKSIVSTAKHEVPQEERIVNNDKFNAN